jgi:hypothetical protein
VLDRQLQFRLYEATFDKIEREILEKRLARINACTGLPIVCCVECRESLSTLFCEDCQDHFCSACWDRIHESEVYGSHVRNTKPINAVNSTEGEQLGS